MVQILFTVFGMGYIYENAQIIDNHGTLLHTTVYEAMVVSVMMYNCSSWAATKDTLKKLDVCHRKHLRKIINVKWPQTISNDKLYEICNTKCLSERVRLARWKMLGHILRSPDNTPAALSLVHAIKGSVAKKRRGSHKANLLKVLRDDMKSMPIDRTSVYVKDLH